MELCYQIAADMAVYRNHEALLIRFDGERMIAGTSVLNGGVCRGIDTLFNYTVPPVKNIEELPGGNVEAYLRIVTRELGLKPETSSGLLTSASMKNAAFTGSQFRGLRVEVIATAGVDVNGGRAGDPASYYEEEGCFYPLSGTINIFIAVNASLPAATLLKSIITATEAKTSALQELMAPSRYSQGLATGSGTDGIIVASEPSARLALTDAGLHSKLGELIGRTVNTAVKKALALETGLTPQRQMHVLERLKRFNIDSEYFVQKAGNSYSFTAICQDKFREKLHRILQSPEYVTLVSSLLHVEDQVQWGLLPRKEAVEVARRIIQSFASVNLTYLSPDIPIPEIIVHGLNDLIIREISPA